MGTISALLTAFSVLATLLVLYIRTNDRKLQHTPKEALKWCERWDEDIKEEEEPIDLVKGGYLFEKTGRRYVVVGGSGCLGGWIVMHLLQRGESARNIRILDIRPPLREDVQAAIKAGVQFCKTDVSQSASVEDAFNAPWPAECASAELTVFHTAAVIRFFERHASLYPLSHAVNVQGTQNVLDAATKAGASVLVYTSSVSVTLKKMKMLLWPWESPQEEFVQVLNGDERDDQDEYWSNYAKSKHAADQLVTGSNGKVTSNGRTLLTGALRPGGPIYGTGGDTSYESYALRTNRKIPNWLEHLVVSNIHVQNCSIAHLAFERSLLTRPDVCGGNSYVITDGGKAPLNGDVYRKVLDWTKDDERGQLRFEYISVTSMLLLSYIIEFIHISHHVLPSPFNKLFPCLTGDILNLQPACLAVSTIHTIVDDRRARKDIGYRTPWDSKRGLRETFMATRRVKMPMADVQGGAAQVLNKIKP